MSIQWFWINLSSFNNYFNLATIDHMMRITYDALWFWCVAICLRIARIAYWWCVSIDCIASDFSIFSLGGSCIADTDTWSYTFLPVEIYPTELSMHFISFFYDCFKLFQHMTLDLFTYANCCVYWIDVKVLENRRVDIMCQSHFYNEITGFPTTSCIANASHNWSGVCIWDVPSGFTICLFIGS